MKNWLAGSLSFMIAVALFLPTVIVFGKTPYHEREEDSSHLAVYTNMPGMDPEISLTLKGQDSDSVLGTLFILFPTRELPPDLRWMIVANDALAFTVRPDGDSNVEGKFSDQMIDGCDGDRTPWGADAVLVGKGDHAWIPGKKESTTVNAGGTREQTGFYFRIALPKASVRADEVGTYMYTLGWFDHPETGDAVTCRVAPDLGKVHSVPFTSAVTVRGDGPTDPVLFADPPTTGRGRVEWMNPDPSTTMTVTFESEAERKRNALLLFLSGTFLGLGAGFLVTAIQRTLFRDYSV